MQVKQCVYRLRMFKIKSQIFEMANGGANHSSQNSLINPRSLLSKLPPCTFSYPQSISAVCSLCLNPHFFDYFLTVAAQSCCSCVSSTNNKDECIKMNLFLAQNDFHT